MFPYDHIYMSEGYRCVLKNADYGFKFDKYRFCWDFEELQFQCSFCGKCGNYTMNNTLGLPLKILCFCEEPLEDDNFISDETDIDDENSFNIQLSNELIDEESKEDY